MSATSNASQLAAKLKGLVCTFGFDATIEGRDLGRDCAGIVADGIAARSIDQQRSPQGDWPANAEKYAEMKRNRYGSDRIGVRTGQMLSVESLLGGTTITTGEVQMLYGTGQAPTRSATGHFDPDTDGQISDVEKAFFFSVRRPFYLLDDAIGDAVFDRIKECCDQYIVRLW